MMPKSYAFDNKVRLNSKYIKTKQNWKLETKFFGLFQILYPVRKKAYKLEFSGKWKFYNVFHVLLLKQDISRKKRVNDNATKLAKLDASNNNGSKYKVEVICNSAVYTRELADYLSDLYYLIF